MHLLRSLLTTGLALAACACTLRAEVVPILSDTADAVKDGATTLTGLTSGKRYWFRVSANGSPGPGPVSDPATKTAP